MGIILSDDFKEQIGEAWERLRAAVEKMAQQVEKAFAELAGEISDVDVDEKTCEAQERRCASILAAQKAAARAKAYGLRMLLEKACRAMRRRKRLHNDGGLPDW